MNWYYVISIVLLGIITFSFIGYYNIQQQSQQQHQIYDNNNSNGSSRSRSSNHEDRINTKTTKHHVCHIVGRELMNDMMKIHYDNNNNNNNNKYINDNNNNMIPIIIIPHTSYIWNYYKKLIYESTRHVNDVNGYYNHFINQLMQYITPKRLMNSRKSLPTSQWKQIDNIINILYERWLYVHNNINNNNMKEYNTNTTTDVKIPPRKLSIFVFGGSVTAGSYCPYTPIIIEKKKGKKSNNINNNKQEQQPPIMTNNECSWPVRLQHFINHLLLGGNNYSNNINNNIVDVYNLGYGGTDTANGKIIWDLSLFPNNAPLHPDIVINSYSTNDDMHYGNNQEELLELEQSFIRLVLKNNNKKNMNNKKILPPLLLYYNDYIGNVNKSILSLYRYNNVLNILSNYYGIGYISFGDTIRDIVYRNTNETWFSSWGWPGVRYHPGQGMHITSIWMITYNILDYMTTYCSSDNIYDDNNKEQQHPEEVLNDNNNNEYYSYKYKDMPKTNDDGVLPPVLQSNLTLDIISTLWDEAINDNNNEITMQQQAQQHNQSTNDNDDRLVVEKKPCYYACDARVLNITEFNETLNQYIIYNYGWIPLKSHKKMGYVPSIINDDNNNDSSSSKKKNKKKKNKKKKNKKNKNNNNSNNNNSISTFIMFFPNITQRVNAIHVIYMKSYGASWLSLVEMTTSIIPAIANAAIAIDNDDEETNTILEQQQQQLLLSGYHNRTTSEIYHDQLDFIKVVDIGDSIQIQFSFIKGINFKLFSIALCDH